MQSADVMWKLCFKRSLQNIFIRDSPYFLKGFWNILYFILVDKNNVVLRAAPPSILSPQPAARNWKSKEN